MLFEKFLEHYKADQIEVPQKLSRAHHQYGDSLFKRVFSRNCWQIF